MNNLNGVDVDGRLEGEGEGHGFRVGDFVWGSGRFPTDPWLPGQVFDPSDASELALKHRLEGHLLVVFFGDNCFAWALPSELVPFSGNLDKLRGANLKGFQKAVDEIKRIVESKHTCKCIPLERRGHLDRPVVVNVGLKAGVLAPAVDVARLSLPDFNAPEILQKVISLAKSVSFDSVFELAILRSWISTYSYARCGGCLCVYSDPIPIEGSEYRDGDDKRVATSKNQRSKTKLVAKRIFLKSGSRKRSDNEVERPSSSKKQAVDGIEDKVKVVTESSSSERRKTKYFSPVEFIGRIRHKLPTSQEQDLPAFSSDSEMDDKAASGEWLDMIGSKNSLAAQNEKRMTFDASDVDSDVEGLLLMLQSAATDVLYLRNEGQLDPVCRAFVPAFRRSSIYLRGPNYQVFNTCKKVGKKRRSIASPSGLRPHGCTPKISSPCKSSAGKRASSSVEGEGEMALRFVKKLKIYNFTTQRMEIPKKFAVQSGIATIGKVILENERGMRWCVIVKDRNREMYTFSSGWVGFLKANKLECDTILLFRYVGKNTVKFVVMENEAGERLLETAGKGGFLHPRNVNSI